MTALDSEASYGEVLEEADVYKGTTSDGLFVLRRTKLFASVFITYHDYEKDKNDKKLWLLDRRCELLPKSASDIREPQTKLIRPPGTWTLTAMIKSKGQSLQLVGESVASHTGQRSMLQCFPSTLQPPLALHAAE